jgi:hypothetical protein
MYCATIGGLLLVRALHCLELEHVSVFHDEMTICFELIIEVLPLGPDTRGLYKLPRVMVSTAPLTSIRREDGVGLRGRA